MAKSTGPILATGAVAIFNRVILAEKPIDTQTLRILVGTGIAAAGLALLENASTELAVGIAWVSLVSVLFVRLDPNTPAPMEAFADWYNKK